MNVSIPTRWRVHWLRAGQPACGGGRHGKKGAWQFDAGEVSCKRCAKMMKAAAEKDVESRKEAQKAQKET